MEGFSSRPRLRRRRPRLGGVRHRARHRRAHQKRVCLQARTVNPPPARYHRHPENAAAERIAAPSWHRGALAGLTEQERKQAIQDNLTESFVEKARPSLSKAALEDIKDQALKHEPTAKYAAALAPLPKTQLESLARALELTGVSKLNKAALAERITGKMTESADIVAEDLLTLEERDFEAIARLVESGPLTLEADPSDKDFARRARDFTLFPPYIFLFAHEGVFTVLVPNEIAQIVRSVDLDEVRAERARMAEVVAYAETATCYYGLIGIDEAYEQYCGLVKDPVTSGDFAGIVYRANVSGECGFELALCDDDVFLLDFTISDSCLGADADEKMAEDLDAYRDYLRKQHAAREPRPLDGLVSPEPSDRLFAIPTAIDLRNYLDAHVPDDDNDYAFADRVMEDVLALFYEGARVSDLPADLGDLGLMDCTDDPKTLIQLATNLYNALPAWDLYGWSSQELMERATGQKTFYNPDGSVRKVGRNEPCPCGSGKKYKNCCGRGARE